MAQEAGYRTPRFLTFEQALELGGNVRKGEHGTKVYFVKQLQVRENGAEDNSSTRLIPMMREHTVFNVDQCENLSDSINTGKPMRVRNPDARDELADAFLHSTGADIRDGGEAYYVPIRDFISMPAFAAKYLRGLVSVREELESYESFVIQERWPDSEGPPMWTNENRARYDRSHLRYPSDLTDDEWKLVEPLIPPGRRGGDKRTVILREVVNGLMYILSTGCQWRAIPKDLPPRSTLYDYFDLWSWDRTLDLIHHELYVKCREAIGREASPTAAVIDSQSVKSAEKGGLRLTRRATTRERRSRARSGTFSSIRKAC
jgi:transposase